ncbi:hypothetical protein ZIOFF_058571 [Zingiber officinale]|uniref:Uncharacterized protein n=1 Tax=Zingiber officinale TaxID=94328 RepID=A0A8J5F3W8_ZINOF|nr:hypothetical protein ZIOFF_058571 [Zingiber officinale]
MEGIHHVGIGIDQELHSPERSHRTASNGTVESGGAVEGFLFSINASLGLPHQVQHGEKNGVDSVFELQVRNAAARFSVFLRSLGFSSSIAVDPKLFHREGEYYLLTMARASRTTSWSSSGTPETGAFSMSPNFSTRC